MSGEHFAGSCHRLGALSPILQVKKRQSFMQQGVDCVLTWLYRVTKVSISIFSSKSSSTALFSCSSLKLESNKTYVSRPAIKQSYEKIV